jgi:hypothetical protein
MKRYRFYNNDVSGNNMSGLKVSLNIEAVGDFYAGDIEHRGFDYYFDKAFKTWSKAALISHRSC